jgi:4-hydroxy-3-methylbut-2-enyl diphosphate reductase
MESSQGRFRIRGVVRRLTEFGAFVDIGGIDGLVHVTDRPGAACSILGRRQHRRRDRDAHSQGGYGAGARVVGLKQTQPKPWEVAQDKYVEGRSCRAGWCAS